MPGGRKRGGGEAVSEVTEETAPDPSGAGPYTRRQLRANLHRQYSRMMSASGTSAVAIDNKIEQAMDLVKSHLMFAVREEVEVLKEKIAELMERINQLEVENSILKAHASSETLAQLGGGGAGGGGQALPPTSSMQMQVQGQQQAS